MFTGCGTALVTPFRRDGSLDEETLRKLVRRQIDAGINFLVPCGTTGESPTLSRREHLRVIEITLEEANGKVPVIGGAGGNNTASLVELAREVERLGASGILSVTPYYNKPTQEGLFQHYQAVAAAIHIPIILYSVQGRTGVNLEPSTVARLARVENIVAIKEASGSLAQVATIINEVPPEFAVLSGDDAVALPVIALGGRGVISTCSNEIPAEMTQIAQACLRGDFAAARAVQKRFLPLMNVNFVESNPIPVKAAMALMGLLEANYRLPMVPASAASLAKIEKVLEAVGLMEKAPLAS
jgi:4-hydroxy-tetrahydrodipicolinate synthase